MNNRLKALRAERDWSQARLGQALGGSRRTVNALATARYPPNLPLACQIAELPKTIKGYGPIRQPHVAAARQQWQQWLAQGFSAQPGP